MTGRLLRTMGGLVIVGSVACAGADDEPTQDAGETAASAVTVTAVAEPDTTGAAMWAHIQESEYQSNWDLWPGMGEKYQGNDPHGALLTTYVNDVAMGALDAGDVAMPAGAVVIKENYMPDDQLAAVTVMYKRPGYNAEHSDWFFAKFLPDGALDQMPNGMAMEGRLPGCQGCHIAKADADYLYTPRPGEH